MVFSGATLPAPYSCLKVGPLGPAGGAAERADLGCDAPGTTSFFTWDIQRSVVHPLLPLLSTLGLEYNISMEGPAWQGPHGKATRAAHRSRARRAGRRLDLRGDFVESVKTGMLPWSTR